MPSTSGGSNGTKVFDKRKLFEVIGYEPHAGQDLYHNSKARFKVAVCGRRFGKALALDTPILTTHGWETMGTLRVGHQVFGEDGRPCSVIAATDVMHGRPCYRVVFSDKSEIIADAEHQWVTWDKPARKAINDPRRHTKPAIRTTEEMAGTLFYGSENNHAIQLAQAVKFPERKLAAHPYVLGVWLGDGNTGVYRDSYDTSAFITCHDDDLDIILDIEDLGYPVALAAKYRWTISNLVTELKEIGVWGNKHVPQQYLFASPEQRLSLLQGLMDSDGGVGGQGQCDFTNMNKALVDAVEWLAVSLGAKVTRYTKKAMLNGKYCGLAYRANVTATFPLFGLQRKRMQQFERNFSSGRSYRVVTKIEAVDSVPVRCIEVDSPSHLYLAGLNLIPTHNSTMAARDLEPELFLRPPNGKRKVYWIVGPTYDLGEREFRVIWDDLMIGRGLGQVKGVKGSYARKQGNMFIELPWGTRVEVKSSDKPDSLVGEGLDGVIFSEAAKQPIEVWEKFIRPALADKHGWATFVTTPEGRENWIHALSVLGRSTDDWESWQFPSWMNNIVYPGGEDDPEIEILRSTMSYERFQQEIAADFTAFVGKVYTEFSPQDHVRRVEYNPAWPNYMFFDWGFINPMGALDVQLGPDDTLYVWREHYMSGLTIEQHAGHFKARTNPTGYKVACGFGDAADPEAAQTMSMLWVPTVVDVAAKANWRQGIDLVKRLLQAKRLVIDPSCVNLMREFESYRGDPVAMFAKEKPAKQHDHLLDALRYGAMHLFELGAAYSLSDVTVGGLKRWADQEPMDPEALERDSGPAFVGAGRTFNMDMDF